MNAKEREARLERLKKLTPSEREALKVLLEELLLETEATLYKVKRMEEMRK